MTPQRILTASLDWQGIMRQAGVRFSPHTRKLINALTEYLCVAAEIEDEEEPEAGTPYQQDLVEDAHEQIKQDCERDEVNV